MDIDTKMDELIKKYMNKYKEFVGVEPNNNSKYNEESFLEIMARSLAFWYLEKIEPSFDSSFINNLELQQKCFYVDQMYNGTIEDIMTKFNDNQQKIIFDRCEILKNKERNNEILKMKKKLKIINDISKQLYDKFVKEINENNGYINASFNFMMEQIIADKILQIRSLENEDSLINNFCPTIWLINQTLMREFYENYINKTNELKNKLPNNYLVDKLISNEFIEYMKFMYNNYPDKYGKELREKFKQNKFCDSAELYYELNK